MVRPGNMKGLRAAGGLLAWLLLLLSACGGRAGDTNRLTDLSPFAEDTLVSGRVVENVTACAVDAVCYLRIEFADTSIVALYGTGERPAPPCEITVETSNAAFSVEPEEVVRVIVSACGDEGLFLRRVVRGTAP